MNKIEQDYIHRHDSFWSSCGLEEFDPFESGHRLVIVKMPRFIMDIVNLYDDVLDFYKSESVRDIIRNRYIL